MLAMLLTAVTLGGLLVLAVASASALKEAIRQRARLRGILLAAALLFGSLLGLWAVLI